MSEPASRPTLDQRRAQHAWQAVEKLGGAPGKEYAGEAKKLPMRIRAAGLGQALAFILAKAQKKPSLAKLHTDLSHWVLEARPMAAKDKTHLLRSVIEGDSDFLRRATDETLAYLQWLNRFAEAKGLGDDA